MLPSSAARNSACRSFVGPLSSGSWTFVSSVAGRCGSSLIARSYCLQGGMLLRQNHHTGAYSIVPYLQVANTAVVIRVRVNVVIFGRVARQELAAKGKRLVIG